MLRLVVHADIFGRVHHGDKPYLKWCRGPSPCKTNEPQPLIEYNVSESKQSRPLCRGKSFFVTHVEDGCR
jgi:hypothetical protein